MVDVTRFTGKAFRASAWALIAFAAIITLVASVGLCFGFGWGFQTKDLTMAVVVLTGTLVIRAVGVTGTPQPPRFGGSISESVAP
jgi:hypothetical protein